MRKLAAVLVIAATGTGCVSAQPPPSDAERSAITEIIIDRMDEYRDAFATFELERIEPFFADHPDFRVFNNGRDRSRDEVLSAVATMGAGLRSIDVDWDTIDVTVLEREAALAAAAFHRTLTDTAGSVTRQIGTATYVWVRRDGTWRILHAQAWIQPDTLP